MLGADVEIDATTDPDAVCASWQEHLRELGTDGTPSTVAEAAAAIAATHPHLDATAAQAELLDRAQIAMINGVLDAERLSESLAIALSPAGIRQRLEGETAMSLIEYAHIRVGIARAIES